MGLRINDIVPNFIAETDQGQITFHDWIGDSWAILFSHPKDYTPVCTTEFGAVAQLVDEWTARNTKVIGLSVDGVEDHKGWKADIESFSGASASFPIPSRNRSFPGNLPGFHPFPETYSMIGPFRRTFPESTHFNRHVSISALS